MNRKDTLSPIIYPEDFPSYRRSPRLIKRVPEKAIKVERPPGKEQMSKTSLVQIIVTPLIMLGITLATGVLMKRGIYVLISAVSAAVSIIGSTAKFIQERQAVKAQNKKREELYDQYLLDKRKAIYEAGKKEEEAYTYLYPSVKQLEAMTHAFSSRIYERNPSDEDFLAFSIGYRREAVSFPIEYDTKELVMEEDPLEQEARGIRQNLGTIARKPVVLDLKKAHLGLVGEKEVIHEQLKLMASWLAFFHSYHELQMVAIYHHEKEETFRWMRWFPHFKIQALNVYGLVSTERMRDQVMGSLHQILKERKQRVEERKKEARFLPHFLFIIDEPKLIMDHSIMEYLSKEGDNLGFSIVYTSSIQANLPENIGTIVLLEKEGEGRLLLENKKVRNLSFKLQSPEGIDYEAMARDLSILTHEKGITARIPENITFFEMYKVKHPGELEIISRWKKSESHKSLSVPLGVRAEEDYLCLNLHEKAHGPHGLVAGTTGSGKSEIVQSYILSLAVNFHPYEVGFLLIDYKGGGMAGLFKNLPHLLGTITNLDGSESMRAMASIKSELARRQRIFSEHNVNHINGYNKLFKLGKAEEPIPHLFLISDEFAELKKEQPEFMKELVSAARIGRSLGIHLILATQKPSGVVDDQIWTNSRFKLALKVQNEADSKEIIKTPDAAAITQPGRAYLQVGNNEIYELFQSAWSGAAYAPDEEQTLLDDRVYVINELGQGELVNGEEEGSSPGEQLKATQLDAVVGEIRNCFEALHIPPVKRPWLPPLPVSLLSPHAIRQEEIRNREEELRPLDLSLPLGLVDIPEEQKQVEYTLDLVREGNLAFFASAGYGKSTFLHTAVLTLAAKNSVEVVQFYLCDFGNNALIALNGLPHTCDYITMDDGERLGKLVTLIREEIKERKKLFAKAMAQNFEVYNQSAEKGEQLKAIILVIDNYDIIKELGPEMEEFFTKTGRDGLGLGIYLLVTAGRLSGIKFNALNNFKNRIAGYLLDSTEASSIVGKSTYRAGEIEGRALVKLEQVHVMQTYTMVEFVHAMEYTVRLKEEVEKIKAMYPTKRAPRIAVLPETFGFSQISDFAAKKDQGLVLGLHKASVELRGLSRQQSPFLIVGEGGKGKTNLARVLAMQAADQGQVYLFDSADMELYGLKDKGGITYIDNGAALEDCLEDLQEMTAENKAAFERAIKAGERITPKAFYENRKPVYILIDDLEELVVRYEAQLKEMTAVFKAAVETGIGIIATYHPGKGKGFDELTKWMKTSSHGVVLGSQGNAAIYPMVPTKELPVLGEGLFYTGSGYERLLIPAAEG